MVNIEKDFKSQQEYALYLAKLTLEKILTSDCETHTILRGCYTIASLLGDSENIEWINKELNGYPEVSEENGKERVPPYRQFHGIPIDKRGLRLDKPIPYNVTTSTHRIEHSVKNKEDLRIWHGNDFEIYSDLSPDWCHHILNSVQDKCLKFLVNKIAQLEFEGRINNLIITIQEEVNNKLVRINPEITAELQSISNNITSKNKSDLSKVAHSCRRILKLLANEVYPASKEPYLDTRGNERKITEDAYMNRLLAFIEQNKGLKLIKCEVDILSSYLDNIRELSGKGEHSELTKYETEQVTVHTYLIISEILKLHSVDKK